MRHYPHIAFVERHKSWTKKELVHQLYLSERRISIADELLVNYREQVKEQAELIKDLDSMVKLLA